MAKGLWGKKIGMTQVFSKDKVVPVTVFDVSQWVVTGIKIKDRDGYDAVQIGRVKDRFVEEKFSPQWLKKAKQYFSDVREIRVSDATNYTVGQIVEFHADFSAGDMVDVFGITKGAGFAGVVRRYGFAGAPGSHGAKMGKAPGSLSFMTACGRVIKGKKMPGHMGVEKRVMKNLEVIENKKDENILLIKGSVPGKSGSLVFIRKA